MAAENQHIEFKSSFGDPVIETLAAFANSKGGMVLVGIRDDGTPNKAFHFGKETLQNWINEIKQKTQPSIIPDIVIDQFQGSNIIRLSVDEFPIKPVAFQGRYYKRIKNSNHLLTVTEIADMNLQSLQVSWDSYQAPDVRWNDLDPEKINRFIRKVNDGGRFRLEGTPKQCLEKLRLIRDGKVTNAAFLLFSKGDIPYNVHMGRFKTPSVIIDDKMLRSSLFEVVEEIIKYLIAAIRVAFEITGKTTQRTEIYEYPLDALRELVLNAVVHRDYISPVDLQIRVFDQSISIFNPSGLFGRLTIDDLKTDHYQASTRNKLIAEAFYLTKDIEKYGSGFTRVRKAISDYPTMKFEYREIANGFLVILSYEVQKISSRGDIMGVTKDVTKGVIKDVIKETRGTKILELIKQNPEITAGEIAILLNVTPRTVLRDIRTLKTTMRIERVGGRKNGYWKVNTLRQL